ncbi:MAG: DUF3857 domain-containing protein [Bacteroidota bacterium]
MRKIIGLFLMLVIILPARSQEEISDEMKKKHPDKMAVILEAKQHVEIDINKGDFEIVSGYYKDVLHLQDLSKGMASDKVYSTHFAKLDKIEALSLVPNKGKYKKLKVNTFNKKNEQSSGIFYDDMESISFVYPAVQPKSRTILEYSYEITDPRVLRTFFFDSYIPVERSQLTIKVHKDVILNYKLFNTENITIDFEKHDKGNFSYYTWKSRSYEDPVYEPDAPDIRYFTPHIIYYIEKVNFKDHQESILASPGDLYKWYYTFVKDINKGNNDELKNIVNSLLEGGETRDEKTRKIFYWVQDNINYVAFEDGMKGLIPQDANIVCEKRYGDCKGMASLLHEMLEIAGVKSYITWIGSRDLPYKYSEVHTPVVDNHMIVAYENEDGFLFLDATGKYTPMGYPTSMIQGKQALIGIDKDNYKIVDVPVIPASDNLVLDSVNLVLEDNSIIGKGSMHFNGYPKINRLYNLAGSKEKDRKEKVLTMIGRGNNKFFVDDFEIIDMKEKDKPMVIDYKFRIEDYHKKFDDEVYINLNLDKTFFNDFIDTAKRVHPVERDYCYTYKFISKIQVPQGYEVGVMPSDASFQGDLFGFNIKYKIVNNFVLQEKTLYSNFLLLEKENFNQWNNFIHQLNKSYRETIALKK